MLSQGQVADVGKNLHVFNYDNVQLGGHWDSYVQFDRKSKRN